MKFSKSILSLTNSKSYFNFKFWNFNKIKYFFFVCWIYSICVFCTSMDTHRQQHDGCVTWISPVPYIFTAIFICLDHYFVDIESVNRAYTKSLKVFSVVQHPNKELPYQLSSQCADNHTSSCCFCSLSLLWS